jgi:hypothetical protein
MRQTRNAFALCTTLCMGLNACGERTGISEPNILVAAPTPSSSKSVLPEVSLTVAIASVDSVGVPYGIRGDGQGDYIDGSGGVQAVLDRAGTFAFNTFASGRRATRWVVYDFSRPVDPSNTYRPTPSNTENYHFSTGPSSLSPFTAIQNLGINGNPASECIYMGNGLANATTAWRVSFHKGHEDVASSPTAFAVVQRTSVSPAVWTIRPVGSCSPGSNVASLRNGDGTQLYGYYDLPFLFRLTTR